VNPAAFTIADQVAAADVQFLDEQINAYNIARTGIDDARLLVSFVRDEQGAIAAGVFGWTWGGCCEIKYLWVAEARRGQGLGSGLLAAAEQEAAARGCQLIVLDTHSFQAPQFYQQRGYEIVGEVAGYPRGYSKFYLKKILAERRGSRVLDSEPS
jgi:GNAT superfamily N-acetyltransferase